MERIGSLEKGILLLDQYDKQAAMLADSFRSVGFAGVILVLQDYGFLPRDVVGLYSYFYRKKTETEGHPCFFNQVQRPDYWVVSGTAKSAEIRDYVYLRGRIQYVTDYDAEPRIVSKVDWNNRKSVIRSSEYYDNYGHLYAREIYDGKGKAITKTYFDEENREVLVENLVTGGIILTENKKTRIFRNKREFVFAFLKKLQEDYGESIGPIYYNSLSYPFFYTLDQQGSQSPAYLFWQEGPRETVPGNMQLILDGKTSTRKIYVQNLASYEAFQRCGGSQEQMEPLGFVYSYKKENTGQKKALICTNSDEIAGLRDLVEGFPQVEFHILAITEMSTKLLNYGTYSNVFLYPAAKKELIDQQFLTCDYYLDLNFGGEILDAVKRAFLHKQLILGLNNTLHNKAYISENHGFQDISSLKSFWKEVLENRDVLNTHLQLQGQHAMEANEEAYSNIINFDFIRR